MAKIRAPVYSLLAHGWLNKYFYQRTGVVKNPYPIGIFGMYLINPIYYSIKGWNYEVRRTWHGIQAVAKHAALPPIPHSPYQMGHWEIFGNAVRTWQSMTQEQKDLYNRLKYPEHTSGYNKFIRWYLRSIQAMPIYWGVLQRAPGDTQTIEDHIESDISAHASIKNAHHSNKAAVILDIDGGGSAITAGIKADVRIPFNCTIKSWQLLADQNGNIVIDVWKNDYDHFPPTNANSICEENEPSLTGTSKNKNDTAEGFDTDLTEGDILRFNVDSVATLTRIHLSLAIEIL